MKVEVLHSGVSFVCLMEKRGMITADQVAGAINDPEFYHNPLTSLVCVENTTNKGGGVCTSWKIYKNWKFVLLII
jgi:threonine aldolase